MATNTYRAQLNYHDSRWGWGNEGTASQGAWDGTGTRTGVLYFPGLASLKSKIVNSVKITVTTGQTGWGLATTKTVSFYRSANQGGIKTSLGANHRTGAAIGSVKGAMYDNTVTYTAAFLAARIAAGDDTYCIYNGSSSTDYLKWTAVTLEVNWSEPATQPSLNKSTVEMGAVVTISTPATNSGYRHTLRYAFGSAGGTIATGVASAHTWTPPVSLAAQIPNAASGSGTIYCDTYSGSTLLGTKSVSITLTVPASVKPTAGTLSAAVADDASGTGLYVKGMGKARLTLSGAAGAEGSTIRSTVISGGGWSTSGTTLTTGVLTAAGTVTFTATVTDSRGRTASTTTSISVIDYARPGISSCTVYRCDSAGAKQNDGTYAAVELSAFYSAISGNTLSLRVAYKRSSESGYGGSTALTNNGKTIIGGGGLSASATYDVRVTAADRYNTVEQVYRLPTKSVLLSFLKNLGAAIGKVAELPGWLDIGLNTRVRESLQVDGSVTWPEQYKIHYSYIPNGADLNDDTYKISGYYRSNNGSATISNAPPGIAGAFELIVTGIGDGNYCTQRVKDYRNNTEWVRTQTTWREPWVWTDWTKITHSDTLNTVLSDYAKLSSPNNLIHSGNEFTFAASEQKGDVWINYKTVGGTNGNISIYQFGNGKGGLASIKAENAYISSHGWITLWNGSLSSGSATASNAKKYSAIILYGTPGSGESHVLCTLPTGNVSGQMASNQAYISFNVTYSGDNATVSIQNNPYNGSISYIWGLVRFKE